jgi:hypothetical protein
VPADQIFSWVFASSGSQLLLLRNSGPLHLIFLCARSIASARDFIFWCSVPERQPVLLPP